MLQVAVLLVTLPVESSPAVQLTAEVLETVPPAEPVLVQFTVFEPPIAIGPVVAPSAPVQSGSLIVH